MNTIKISSHRARIIEALQNCGYVREIDHKIIICESDIALIDGAKIAIVARDDELWFQEYVLTGISECTLTWSKKGHADVVWRKGDITNLRKMAEYLGKMC